MKVATIMSLNPVHIEATALIAEALSTLDTVDVRHLPVLSEGRVVGVVSDRDLYESTGWMWNEEDGKAPIVVADLIDADPVLVGPGETAAALAARLVEFGIGCAPVVEAGRLLGIVTELDLLRAYSVVDGAGPTVQERMTTDVVTLDPTSTAADAMEAMREGNLRHLPVTAEHRVLGLVSDRDLRAHIGRALSKSQPVQEFMTRDVRVIEPDEDLRRAAGAMVVRKIGALPVVDEGVLVGILTVTDLLEHCADALRA